MENHYNCIYMYINKINNKRYVGQAKNFRKRHNSHKAKDSNDTPIDNAFNKYGENNFEIKILKENLQTQCLLNFWESYYIDKFNTLSKNNEGYNISSGGSNGNPFAGKTDEEMNKRNKMVSDNAKKRLSNKNNHPMYGKHHSEETKQKIKKSLIGTKLSDETKQKIGESQYIKVNQYSKDGALIKTWNSVKEAQETLKIKNGISSCCIYYKYGEEWWRKNRKSNIRKSVGGFIWRYADEIE